jgi:DNA-binding FrmR family transcriptional regulator
MNAPQTEELARTKHDMVVRLRRIEGQLRGIQKMIEDDASCEDIAQQLAASCKALAKAFYHMLACAIQQPQAFPLADARKKELAPEAQLKRVADLIAKFS